MYAGVTGILVACALVVAVFLQSSSSKAQVSPASPMASATTAIPTGTPAAPVIESKPVDVSPPVTAVLFAAEPLDAHVFDSDTDLGSTPINLDVPNGASLKLEVRRPGYRSRTIVVDGSEKRVSVKLAPASDHPRATRPVGKGKARPKSPDRPSEIINPWATR
jgi:hypothetical protein